MTRQIEINFSSPEELDDLKATIRMNDLLVGLASNEYENDRESKVNRPTHSQNFDKNQGQGFANSSSTK